ncbi:outer membrane beta-barrel protein [Aliiruegeria lutimaris]|uniref:Outer membrane protein beta-barrel domain-containing protein n=1 Tax=Aliiruegeria lutimaris TaxID=571298 RepID=A0A1G9AE42_9RHOB|nr:outer membrane beta-barrel protein [Aliiruegeria lutimaris]SDK25662.1 Outer membrane protein beta-barrel domain-containing protein [Aliiruegeria lutimaris]
MKKRALALMLACCAVPVQAQQSEWRYTGSAFGWFTGLSSSVETRLGTVEIELDFGDVWDKLDFAFFGSFEARNGRWALVTDLVYADLGSEIGTPFGVAFRRAEVDARLTLISAYAAYAIVDTADFRLEVGPGFRYNDASIDVRLVGNTLRSRNFSLGDTWIDPLVGARIRFAIDENWFANAFVDMGGFGFQDASDKTWQGYAGLGYRFNETWSVQVGYRSLTIEREFSGRNVTLDLAGPMLGVQASF